MDRMIGITLHASKVAPSTTGYCSLNPHPVSLSTAEPIGTPFPQWRGSEPGIEILQWKRVAQLGRFRPSWVTESQEAAVVVSVQEVGLM